MTESETILFANSMDVFDRFRVYMDYYIDMLESKYTSDYYKEYGIGKWKAKSFDDFCSPKNIIVNDTGCEDWKERGYGSKSWISLDAGSLYHKVYLNK